VKPFAIAGLQMPVSATESNLEAMQQRLDALMYIYLWVQMVVFSELVTFGPSPSTAQPMPGPAEEAFCAMAEKHQLWLIPGSMYERVGKRDRRLRGRLGRDLEQCTRAMRGQRIGRRTRP
jgi:deaminated glutathione amidase